MILKSQHQCHRHGFVLIELLAVFMIIVILIALLLPAVQQAREAARCTNCKNNLLQLGIALQNYQAAHQVLPPGTVNPTGPIISYPQGYHVSWVIQILPFLGEKSAFQTYNFQHGVYNNVNQPVSGYVLDLIQCPSSARGGFNYVGCHNDIETPIDVDNNGALFLNSSIRLKDLKDGRACTILIGEALDGGFLGWTSGTSSTLRNMGTSINAPAANQKLAAQANPYGVYLYDEQAENPQDQKDPETFTPEERKQFLQVGGFSSAHSGGAFFGLCDGSVRFISENTDTNILRNLANRHDGNLIGEY